jgi:hypothetical protein
VEQTHVFDLYLPGRYEVSVVDEVLVMHNVRAKVSLLFDIRTDSKEALAGPLPVVFLPGVALYTNGSDEVNVVCPEEPNGRLNEDWHSKRLRPRYLLHFQRDRMAGCVWKLSLDYPKIARSWPASQQTRLVDFLLKRSSMDSKLLILSLLRDLCYQRSSLHLLSRLFRMFNSTLYQVSLFYQC